MMTENNTMTESKITFNNVPEAINLLIDKTNRIEGLIETLVASKSDEIQWLDINALCEYLPDKPAKQTVYGWVCKKTIPYHKKGKKLQFLKSEINHWLISDEPREKQVRNNPKYPNSLPNKKKTKDDRGKSY